MPSNTANTTAYTKDQKEVRIFIEAVTTQGQTYLVDVTGIYYLTTRKPRKRKERHKHVRT